jgi:hypothetical protein
MAKETDGLPLPAEGMTRSEKKAATRAFMRAEERETAKALARESKQKLALVQKRGRPSKHTPEIETEILLRLANGESIPRICLDSHMPDPATIFHWLEKSDSFRHRYSRARESQAHLLFDQCLTIADDTAADVIETTDSKGNPVMTSNPSAVARARLMVETRFRMAGKLSPKVYGERADMAAAQVNVQVNALTVDARQLAPEQRDSLRQLLLQARGESET